MAPVIPDKLCALCKNIAAKKADERPTEWTLGERLQHYPTVAALKASADAACHLCSLAYGTLRHVSKGQWCESHVLNPQQMSPQLTLTVQFRCSGAYDVLDYTCAENTSHPLTGQLRMVTDLKDMLTGQHDEAKESLLRWETYTGSSNVLKCIRLAIKHCNKEHGGCMVVEKRPVPSARLLRIYQRNGSQFLRLRRTKNFPKGVRYTTLSYCWGTTKTFRLTEDTKESLRHGVNIDHLPQTFQDACAITRALGVRYVWIDSLCIKQDNIEDWNHEAPRMGQIYRNSWLTIAAGKGDDSSAGIFTSRNPLHCQPCKLYHNEHFVAHAYYFNIFEYNQTPLSDRAWTLQKKLVSSRNVLFGPNLVSFACLSESHHEIRPHAVMSPLSSTLLQDVERQTAIKIINATARSGFEKGSFAPAWRRLVELYTRRKLTFPSDRLSAITGIILAIENRAEVMNYAGMWEHRMIGDLLWKVSKPVHKTNPPIAPSWSWAKVDSPVLFEEDGMVDFRPTHELVAFLEKVEVSDNIRITAVKCSLLLRANIRRLNECMSPQSNFQSWMDFHHVASKVAQSSPQNELWCLPIISRGPQQMSGLMSRPIVTSGREIGLCLSRIEGHGPAWERVGMYIITGQLKLMHRPLEIITLV